MVRAGVCLRWQLAPDHQAALGDRGGRRRPRSICRPMPAMLRVCNAFAGDPMYSAHVARAVCRASATYGMSVVRLTLLLLVLENFSILIQHPSPMLVLQLRHTSVTDLPAMGRDGKTVAGSASNGDIQMSSGLDQNGGWFSGQCRYRCDFEPGLQAGQPGAQTARCHACHLVDCRDGCQCLVQAPPWRASHHRKPGSNAGPSGFFFCALPAGHAKGASLARHSSQTA